MKVSPQPYLPRMVRYWDEDAPGQMQQCLEGSMVFVDISGFTAMSERLAKHGKLGAEELTAVIASTFGELLGAAYSFGASLLKFGEDALLLFFSGDGHRFGPAPLPVRCSRGWMRSASVTPVPEDHSADVGRHPHRNVRLLPGGWVPPRADRLRPFGGAHRGDGGCGGAGQILLSPGTGEAIPASNRGRPLGPGVLLKGDVEAERMEIRHATSPTEEFAQFVPIGLCQLLLSGEVEPEHRPAAVAFLHYQGVDDIIASDGAEVAAQRLDALVRAVQEAVDERSVTFMATDIATNGGKIILTAGVPTTTGRDEEEMLLALRQVISDRPALPVSVGVSWGRIFAGEVGTRYRRTYTVMGDTVNLAARLMARAPAGEICATTEIVAGSRTTFEVDQLEPFLVKGKKLPVTALSVGEPKGSKSQREAGGLPLIGRDQELALLNGLGESLERKRPDGRARGRPGHGEEPPAR